jgi:hypothetical protein
MIRPRLTAVAIAALSAAALAAGQAGAQTDAGPPTKLKPKSRDKAAIVVAVTNERSAVLVELDVAPTGSPAVKAVLKKLGPGKKAMVTFPYDQDCLFDIHVEYEDGKSNDVSNLDVCKDAKLNLTE